MGRYNLTRIDAGRKCRILPVIKTGACTVVAKGEGSPLYDPGSELCYYWEGESSTSITINRMGKRKEVKGIITAVVLIIRYQTKLHYRLIDSIWTTCCMRWAFNHLGRRCGARTNQRLAYRIGVFSPCRVVSTRESSVCFLG